MMLEVADDNLVAGFDEFRGQALRHEMERLGGAADKDDFVGAASVEEGAGSLARLLEMIGRALAQLVNAAMHIGVVATVELGNAVDDARRLLRAGAGIEKHQPGIVLVDRELAAQRLGVE